MAGSAVAAAPVVHRQRGVVRIEVALTTASDGSVPETVIGAAFGRLVGVLYDGGLDASGTVTLKDFKTGNTLFTLTTGTEDTPVFMRPTCAIVDAAGAAISAADTAPNINRDIKVGGKLTITVASGGDAETGKIAFLIDEKGLGDLALTV